MRVRAVAVFVALLAVLGALAAPAMAQIDPPVTDPPATEPPPTQPPETTPPTAAPTTAPRPTVTRPRPTSSTATTEEAPTTTLGTLPPAPAGAPVPVSTTVPPPGDDDGNVSAIFPILSFAGFGVVLALLGLQWLLTAPGRHGRTL